MSSVFDSRKAQSLSVLGYGDVFIPALLLSMAIRIDFIEAFLSVKADLSTNQDTPLPRAHQFSVTTLMELRERVEVKFNSIQGRILYKGTLLGYILGFCITIGFLNIYRKPVPALLFILPAQIMCFMATAFYQKGWSRMYKIILFDEDKTLLEQQTR